MIQDRIKGNTARVIWDAPADTGGLPVVNYNLQMYTHNQDQWITVYNGPEKQHTLHSLLPGAFTVVYVTVN